MNTINPNSVTTPQNTIINSITISDFLLVCSGNIILRETDSCRTFNINNFLLEVEIINNGKNKPEISMIVNDKDATLKLINPNNPLGVCSSTPITFAKGHDGKQLYIDFTVYQIVDKFVFHYTFLLDK